MGICCYTYNKELNKFENNFKKNVITFNYLSVIESGKYATVNKGYINVSGDNEKLIVAQKVPNANNSNVKSIINSFNNEIEIFKLIREKLIKYNIQSHPGICKYYSHVMNSNQSEIIIECFDKDLFEYLLDFGNTLMTINEVTSIIIQLLLSLKFLHDNNPVIIHRDIKLENILINNRRVVISDFGLSGIDTGNNTGRAGTYEYIAPEVMFRKGYTHKSDYYSLGVVLFSLLTGKSLRNNKKTIREDDFIKIKYSNSMLLQRKFGKINNEIVPRFLIVLLDNLLEYDKNTRWNWKKALKYLSSYIDIQVFLKNIYREHEIDILIDDEIL